MIYIDYKYQVKLVDEDASLEQIASEIETEQGFAHYHAKVSLEPLEEKGLFNLIISVPPEGADSKGPLQSFVKYLIKTRTGKWIIAELD